MPSWTELGQEALYLENRANRLAELWEPDRQKIHDMYMRASTLWNQAELDDDCRRCFCLAVAQKKEPEEEHKSPPRKRTKIIDYFQAKPRSWKRAELSELSEFM